MILLLFLIIGLIIGIFRGGGLSGLDRMKLHALWLVLVSAMAEIALFVLQAFPSSLYTSIVPAIQMARFIPLILFAVLNIRNWRICIAALGLIANFAVISVNHWQMPIGWSANDLPQFAKEIKDISAGLIPGYTVMKQAYDANLWFLADLLPVFRPEIGFASVGDILLGFGVLLTVEHGMARYSIGKHVRGSLASRSAVPRTTVSRRQGSKQMSSASPIAESVPAEVTSALEPEPIVKPMMAAKPSPYAEPALEKMELPETRQEQSWAPAYQKQDESQTRPELTRQAEPYREPEPERTAEPDREDQPLAEKRLADETPGHRQKLQRPGKWKREDKALDALTGTAAEPQLLDAAGFPKGASKLDSAPEYGADASSTIKLTPRLMTVAEMTGHACAVADVGCDHGKLSAWLSMNNTMKVIAMDISSKSLAKTKLLVKQLSLQSIVQTRVSSGLKKLRPGEADVIVISGLGGPTICSILEEGRAIASTTAKLVLQPMNAVGMVRRWLADNGYCITGEQLAEEDSRIYQILSAVPGADACPPMSLFDLEIGHLLIDNRHPLLQKLLGYKIATIDKILSEIANNASPKAEARRSELISLRERCSEVLEWLAK